MSGDASTSAWRSRRPTSPWSDPLAAALPSAVALPKRAIPPGPTAIPVPPSWRGGATRVELGDGPLDLFGTGHHRHELPAQALPEGLHDGRIPGSDTATTGVPSRRPMGTACSCRATSSGTRVATPGASAAWLRSTKRRPCSAARRRALSSGAMVMCLPLCRLRCWRSSCLVRMPDGLACPSSPFRESRALDHRSRRWQAETTPSIAEMEHHVAHHRPLHGRPAIQSGHGADHRGPGARRGDQRTRSACWWAHS